MREPQDFSPWWLTAPFCHANRLRLFGQDGVFPQLQLARKMRQQGAKRVGATEERCPCELVSCGRTHATFTSFTPTASPTLSVLSSDSSSALRENRQFSPASAGVELTAPETCAAECIWDVPMSLKPFLLADSVPGSTAACTDKSHTAGLRPASVPKRCAARLA